MAHLEAHPDDIEHFVTVSRAMDKAGQSERARVLLEMVDDGLSQNGLWNRRLDLLREIGLTLFEPKKLHPTILKCLQSLHGTKPSYDEMVEKVGLKRATEDIPKTWKKVERLTTLLELDIDTVVYLEGQGAGVVTEVNMQLDSFNIKLRERSIRVGFGGAAKLLTPLEPDHVLRRILEQPDELIRLRDEDPSELLHVVLESFPDPLTGADVRQHLAGVVDEKQWSRWWAKARKHPQVVAAPGGRRAYTWAESAQHAHGAVWSSFDDADPRGKLDLLRQNAGRDDVLKGRMTKGLIQEAEKSKVASPGLAAEIWFGIEKWGLIPEDAAWEPDWSPRAQIGHAAEDADLRPIFAGILDRTFRERAYEIARETRSNWPELFAEVVWQESDPKALDRLTKDLRGRNEDLFGSFFDLLVSQPHKHPAGFTWLAERAGAEPSWMERNPIRLFRQILRCLPDDSFAPFKTRLEPLAESGGTLPRLLGHLDEEGAKAALHTLEKSHGLADYQRKPLITAIHLRFPHLREDEEVPLYALAASIDAKHEELRVLAEEEIPTNRRAIETARELGDLRENFEYKSARQRHEYLSARAQQLDNDLKRARPIDPSTVTGKEIVIGSKVSFEGEGGATKEITILGPWESKPEENILSNQSEMAQGLLGSKLGSEVKIAGQKWKVAAIEPYG